MKFIRMTFIILLLLFINYLVNISYIIEKHNYILSVEESGMYNYKNIVIEEEKEEYIIETFYGVMTGYDAYCDGCIGITASGYDVRNTIYYDDNEYGNVKIIATDRMYPFGTIIRISNTPGYDSFNAIVLDRGSSIGNNKSSQVDLLFSNRDLAYRFGRVFDVKFEILRWGY